MEIIQYVRKTDLARNTSQVIRDVLRGQTAVVENHGQAEVAIIDIIDYRIQRACIHYYALEKEISEAQEVSYQTALEEIDEQERYNRALALYLAELASLSRAAEQLNLPPLDLRMRLLRLGIPLRMGVETEQELAEDVKNALTEAR